MRTVILALLLLLPSCATMMGGGGPWMVPIDTVPQGAMVVYRDFNVGVTPCTIAMRSATSRFTLRREGFHDQVVEAGYCANAMLLGNLLFGGIVGLAVDASSGASTRMSTDPCWVELTPIANEPPGIWLRPDPPREHSTSDDEGWIPEGQTAPLPVVIEKRKPTRAPSAKEQAAAAAARAAPSTEGT